MDMVFAGLGILLVRIVVGLAIAAHGSQKLLGWFGGNGLEATGGFFEILGFHPGKTFAFIASLTEIGSGLLLILGLGGPVGPALLLMVMIVGAGTVHFKNGFFAAEGGFELNVLYGSVALLLAFAGMGMHSLDHVFHLEGFYSPARAWIAIGIAIVLAIANLALRRPTPANEETKSE